MTSKTIEPFAWAVEISGTDKIFSSQKAAENARRRYEKVFDAERMEPFPIYRHPAPLSPDHSGGGAGVVLPEGFMICERSIWTEQQVESAAKCITLLKDVPGITARDLALAAMDAGQCNAPDITLSDFPCIDKVKELNQ
jgi:hypothetical protein